MAEPFGEVWLSENPKGDLMQLASRYFGRAMEKHDILYHTNSLGERMHQATCTLNCADGSQFVGEVCANQADAERAAAQQALMTLQKKINDIIGSLKAVGIDSLEPTDVKVKARLRVALIEVLQRDLTDDDIVYDITSVMGGFQAVLKMPFVPGALGQCAWAGSISAYKRDTTMVAAGQGLDAMLSDPLVSQRIDISKISDEALKKQPKPNRKRTNPANLQNNKHRLKGARIEEMESLKGKGTGADASLIGKGDTVGAPGWAVPPLLQAQLFGQVESVLPSQQFAQSVAWSGQPMGVLEQSATFAAEWQL